MVDLSDKWLVETEWLAEHLDAPDLAIIDATWHMPSSGRDAYADYLESRIPGAAHFDIDKIADTSSPLPHMLPSPEQFSSAMGKMGVGDGMRLVVYDAQGMFSAARVWWTFRAMGTEDVAVLNGGFAKWKAEECPLAEGPPRTRGTRQFTSRRNAELTRDRDEILAMLSDKSAQIVDARSAERFRGDAPEPREGLRSGHIPGSINMPYTHLLNSDGTFKPAQELKKIIENTGVDLARPIANTCGSGVTASIVALALAILGHRHSSVYDGSWSEWGADDTLPMETGG